MDIDVMDSLEDLGYTGEACDESDLKVALQLGPKSVKFTKIVEWLSKELQVLCNLECCVNAIEDPNDSDSFLLEVSSFLKELNCPYQVLVDGPINERLSGIKRTTILLDYLCSELHAARIISARNGDKNLLSIEMDASSTALSLGSLITNLGIEFDTNEDPMKLYAITQNKVSTLVNSHPELVTEPALEDKLSEAQWAKIDDFQKELHEDYYQRRDMLLTRLDVTAQSFKWGEAIRGKEDRLAEIFAHRRRTLKLVPSIDTSCVIAARKDVFIMDKVTSADLLEGTKTSVKKVIIPRVPDRGGRPSEQRPPVEVEMPSWQKRSQHGGGGWGGGAGGSRGRGRGGGGGYGKNFRGRGGQR